MIFYENKLFVKYLAAKISATEKPMRRLIIAAPEQNFNSVQKIR